MATTQWLMSHAKLLTKVKVLILAAILVAQSHANQIWDHSVYLNEDYLLQWTVKEPDILFEVQVKAHGYIGFGFSRDGTIYGADVFIGWIDEGHISFYVSTQVQLSKCMLLLTFFPASTEDPSSSLIIIFRVIKNYKVNSLRQTIQSAYYYVCLRHVRTRDFDVTEPFLYRFVVA